MEIEKPGISFNTLRRANMLRIPRFKNAKGEVAHNADGSDWSPAQWLQAVVGELGEYANVRKKFERGDMDEDEFKLLAAAELADVQTYLDILAYRLGIDLGDATMMKFNAVSNRVRCGVKLSRYGVSDYEINMEGSNIVLGSQHMLVSREHQNEALMTLAEWEAIKAEEQERTLRTLLDKK